VNAVTRSRLAFFVRAAAPAIITFVAAVLLLLYPPAQYSFYPQCPIHHYLHILCPGCGATRALAALLRGDLVEALRVNILTTLLMPVALVYAVACYGRVLRRNPVPWPQPPTSAIYAALAGAVIFTVVRNL
jgi:hypothetical protein